jgi:glutamyl-tRNA reductase
MAKTNKDLEQEQAQPTAKDLHARLKDIVQREIDNLPAALEQLEPKERIKTLSAFL